VPVIPADLKYGQDHMWARPGANGGLVRVGLTDFAQGSLGDVVDVSLPGLDDTVDAGEPCGDIESVKSVNDLIAPVSGTVRRRNDELANAPELINSDPYGQGWMFEIEANPTTLSTQLGALLDAHAYRGLTGA
jgi:glycine cleavage system H protein